MKGTDEDQAQPPAGTAVPALAVAVAAILATTAGAKPSHTSVPQTGVYSGDSIAQGKSHSVIAIITKKGSRYTAEIEIVFPAKCHNTETDLTLPTELLYKVKAQVKGKSISFKGNVRDEMGILYPLPSTVTLTGRFISGGKITATATAEAPAEGIESPRTAQSRRLSWSLNAARSTDAMSAIRKGRWPFRRWVYIEDFPMRIYKSVF